MARPYSTLDRASLDCLESLHAAYVGLQVLSAYADTDSHHVAAILGVLNDALGRQIFDLTPKPSGLSLVKED